MKIDKKITEKVSNAYKELQDALLDATLKLLALVADEGEDIKFEKPIPITTSKCNEDGVTTIEHYIVDTIGYGSHKDSGFYIISLDVDAIASSTFLDCESRMKVYEAVKALVRHKE